MADAPRPSLLPCPFCGHGAWWAEPERGQAWGSHIRRIICSSSHCRAAVELPLDLADQDNGAELARMWNRRAVQSARPAMPDERALVRLVYEHFRSDDDRKALLRTVWKDSIDIDEPRHTLKQFCEALLGLGGTTKWEDHQKPLDDA